MAVPVINFTTGPSTLPDIGVLSYNGCIFSPLFETSVSGLAVKDNAQRTVKYMEYTITVDGYVTLPTSQNSIEVVTVGLRELLSAQGGKLTYKGRGFDLILGPDTVIRDAAWGPVPEILDFQPLGAGKSAKIRWQVKVRVLPKRMSQLSTNRRAALIQFNYETVVSYGEDYFSNVSFRGTIEIPLTRTPLQSTRTLTQTVDTFRTEIDMRLMDGIDLSRFRVTQRSFNVSRDKRLLEFEVTAEEKPYMDLPPWCPIARGSYSVRPARAGMGLVTWLCTLRCTYVVRADKPRRTAWLQFLALLRERMKEADLGNVPAVANGDQNPNRSTLRTATRAAAPGLEPILYLVDLIRGQNRLINNTTKALLIDFSFDEGIYLDSKTVTFSASWRLVTSISHILLASGIWKKVPETTDLGENKWEQSMKDVSGSTAWLPNILDPSLDVIVDFGGP